MKISQLIRNLKSVQNQRGDIDRVVLGDDGYDRTDIVLYVRKPEYGDDNLCIGESDGSLEGYGIFYTE